MVVGVTDEEEGKVRAKMKSAKMEFPVARAPSDVHEAYPIPRGFPTTFIVDKDGTLLWTGHPAQVTSEAVASLFE